MKKLIMIVPMLFSVSAFAHSGHSLFEFTHVLEAARHVLSSPYHIAALLMTSMALIASAVIVAKKQQILTFLLMVLGVAGSMLGMGLLLS